jgi:uncharacterized membrane protein
MFATGMLGLSILCFILNDFIIGRPPAWPETLHINPALAYITGAVLLFLSTAVLAHKQAGMASLLIAALILIFSFLRHLPLFFDFSNSMANGTVINSFKTGALIGGALIVACSFFINNSHVFGSINISATTGRTLLNVGCILLAAFFLCSAYAHYIFADFIVKFLMPSYIPFPLFWAYFCGVCLALGGIGILISGVRKWAALLSGIMVSGWFILLHVPRFFTNMKDPSDQMGLCESFIFAGIFFVVAGLSEKQNR